eukprot:944698-Rhodomonas_salina.2
MDPRCCDCIGVSVKILLMISAARVCFEASSLRVRVGSASASQNLNNANAQDIPGAEISQTQRAWRCNVAKRALASMPKQVSLSRMLLGRREIGSGAQSALPERSTRPKACLEGRSPITWGVM